ncbi:MAG: hypothetical protein OXT49_02205, partial [Gammaproteobacteria bacterium]|nr:hypothetical protein [Gammaproteobacteria bacterium]
MKQLSIALLGLTISAAVSAADTIQLNNSNTNYDASRAQSDFRTILADMGGAFNYKALNPAEPQGLLGFDLGLNATFANVSDEQAWLNLTGDSIEQIGSIGVKLSKGLPLGLDVSGFYNIVPGTDASFYG